jgi:hypothetical protein
MKLVRLIPILCLYYIFLIIQGCSSNSEQKQTDTTFKSLLKTPNGINSSEAFKNFLKEFRTLSLPLTIETLAIVADSSNKLNTKDNIFIKSEYPDEIYAYGLLPDTTDNYKIIWLEPTEIEIPVLTTFTKDGKKINEEELGVGECGSACGFKCNEYISLNKDMSIFSVDSEKITDCDTNGNFTGKEKRSIRYKTGKILANGKISMSEVIGKAIDN